MNIVIFAHFAGSPHHGMVHAYYHLAREWVLTGNNVTIVAASFTHLRLNQPTVRGSREEYIDGIRYIWIPAANYSADSNIGRVRNIIGFSLRCWLRWPAIEAADLVICSSHHPFPIYAARQLARRHRARLVFEVRDLWPMTLVELGGLSKKHPFVRLMQWFENFAYKHADKVVSVLPMAREYMIERGMAPEKFLYIPNGICISDGDKQEFLPKSYVESIEKIHSAGKFIIGYSGRVGGLANTLHILIEALALCRNKNVNVAILGNKSNSSEVFALAKDMGVDGRVLMLDTVTKQQANHFNKLIDAGYVGFKNRRMYKFGVSPTKLNDYMLAGKPILYSAAVPNNDVTSIGAGFSCQAEDAKDLSRAIDELFELSIKQRAQMGNVGHQWIIENRDYKILAARYIEGVCT